MRLNSIASYCIIIVSYAVVLQKNSLGTIRNAANICCVQFSSYSTNLLFFGSADFKVYGYDLRHTRIPWCTLTGHGKAVSYVKFIDAEAVVSSSTDNSLKLWDLKKTSSTGLSSDACALTYKGHSNEKVGLSKYFTTLFCIFLFVLLIGLSFIVIFFFSRILLDYLFWMDTLHVVQNLMRYGFYFFITLTSQYEME